MSTVLSVLRGSYQSNRTLVVDAGPVTAPVPGQTSELRALLMSLAADGNDISKVLAARGRRWQQLRRAIAAVSSTLTCADRVLLQGPALMKGTGTLRLTPRPSLHLVFRSISKLEPIATCATSRSVCELLSDLALDDDAAAHVLLCDALLVFFGRHQGRDAVAHWSMAAFRDRLVMQHADNLALLAGSPIRAIVPNVLHRGILDERAVLVQTRLSGTRFDPASAGSTDIRDRLSQALEVLCVLGHEPTGRDRPEATLFRQHLSDLPEQLPAYASSLRLALGRLSAWLDRRNLLPVRVHGDYGFHNILFSRAGMICGVVDWDRLRQDGLPGYDALHLLMSCLNERGICSYPDFIIGLWRPEQRAPDFQRELEFWLASTGWTEADAAHIGLFLWLALLFHGCIETPPPDGGWLDRVAGQPASVLAACVTGWT
jgi:hypothetical protein